MTPEEIRKAVVDAATACVGLRADDQKYLDFVAPGETPERQAGMSKMSGCALTVAGIWRAAGLSDPKLDAPYKDGQAVSRLISIAKANKAWCQFAADEYPEPGDMVLIGDNTTTGGFEHVYTVTAPVEGETSFFDTVDGGQVDANLQCIKAKRHKWLGKRDKGFSNTDPGSNTSGGRIIIGHVDVTLMPFSDNPY
jgi:hypothetical protein